MKTVFYPELVPNNRLTITQLAIIFDQILLPGTYLPLEQLDKKELQERIIGIEKVDKERGENSTTLLLPLKFALEYGELSSVFIGTGRPGYMGSLEPGAQEMTREIEELYWGPPRPGFFPTPSMGFNMGVGKTQINGPAEFSYPANAYIYARKHDLPLLSDTTPMPVPGNMPHNSNAKFLSSQLAFNSLDLLLPRFRPLTASQILEIRERYKEDIRAFHSTMLSYSGKLRKLVGETPDMETLKKEARFIAESEVLPIIEHLRHTLESPGKIIKRNMLYFSLNYPEIIAQAAMQPENPQVWIDALKAVGKQIHTTVEEIRSNAEKAKASGLNLILKLPS